GKTDEHPRWVQVRLGAPSGRSSARVGIRYIVVKLLGGRAASAVIGFLMLAFSSNVNAQAIVNGATALATPAIAAVQAQSVPSVSAKAPATMATQAAWLYKGGWGLQALVDKFATNAQLDEQTNCLATAVYFEARGESVEGQLAVARVVM